MSDPFEAAPTKLAAAKRAVGDYVAPFTNQGLALRRIGGECDAGGEQLVDFGNEHADEVTAEADELQADGQSNLVKTVLVAIDDFSDAERFPDPESPRRVVVFTGTSDSCGDGTDEICDEIEQTGIDAEFNLVGLKVSPEDRERLRNLQEQDCLGEQADVEFADTSEELNDAVADLPRPDDVPDCAPSC